MTHPVLPRKESLKAVMVGGVALHHLQSGGLSGLLTQCHPIFFHPVQRLVHWLEEGTRCNRIVEWDFPPS